MTATTTTDFGAALNSAIQGDYIAQLNGGTYTISSPIFIHISSTTQGIGIDGGGETLISNVTNGQPLVQIAVAGSTTGTSPTASPRRPAAPSPACISIPACRPR
jgi:hypothetical protein